MLKDCLLSIEIHFNDAVISEFYYYRFFSFYGVRFMAFYIERDGSPVAFNSKLAELMNETHLT